MNRLFRRLPMACLLSFLLLSSGAVGAVPVLVTYPAPAGELPSADYAVEANGKPVFVYRADVLHGGPASFASFDFSGTVQVAVTSQRPVHSAKIRPNSAGISPTVQNKTIRFELSRPGQLTVELNDGIERPLHLFADPVEADTPRPDDPHVLYFGPGVHEVGTTKVRSNTTVYLAGGAIVRGIIRPDEKPVGESFAKKKTYMPIFLIEGALGVTYETRCNVTNVLFADCDVIHDLGIASLAAHVSDSGTVSSLRFENIRLEDVKNRAVRLWIGKGMWGHDSQRGHIRGVVFKDVSLVGGSAPQWELTGHDADHRVADVVFENLRLFDKVIRATGEARFAVNAYVENLRFRPENRDR